MDSRKEECVRYIKEKVGNNKVLCLVSGGYESSVCAALLVRSLNPLQVIILHVDNGLMRKGESEKIEKSLKEIGIDVIVKREPFSFLNGSTQIKRPEQFSAVETSMLCETYHPEEKRKIIRDNFVRIANDVIEEFKLKPEELLLAQPSLRYDTMESEKSMDFINTDNFKTHQSETDLIKELRNAGRVVELLCDFQKHEVIKLGMELGLPSVILENQPLPGSGLAVRILCANEAFLEKDYYQTQVLASVIVNLEEKILNKHALINLVTGCISENEQRELSKISQHSKIEATVLPIKTLGIRGDMKTYNYAVCLSTPGEPNWNDLLFLAEIIPRIIPNINRVCYAFGDLITAQVTEITPTTLNGFALKQLRQVDDIVNNIMIQNGLIRKLSQMPVILIPIHFDRDFIYPTPSCCRSVVLRPFLFTDFVTGVPAVPGSSQMPMPVLHHIVQEVQKVEGISRVLYDLTAKPPGDIEWE